MPCPTASARPPCCAMTQFAFLDAGEQMLWTHALTRSDAWVFCGPDKASLRLGIRLGFRERLVSLERLLLDAGFRSKIDLRRSLHATLAGEDAHRAVAPGRQTLMTTSVDVRAKLVDLLRRDLFGPHPELDPDLEREVLYDKPSRFYVGGFIVPAFDGAASALANADEDEEAEKVADDLLAVETLDLPIDARDGTTPTSRRRPISRPRTGFCRRRSGLPSCCPRRCREFELVATWGDYRAEPPLPEILVLPEAAETGEKKPDKPQGLLWVRSPGQRHADT